MDDSNYHKDPQSSLDDFFPQTKENWKHWSKYMVCPYKGENGCDPWKTFGSILTKEERGYLSMLINDSIADGEDGIGERINAKALGTVGFEIVWNDDILAEHQVDILRCVRRHKNRKRSPYSDEQYEAFMETLTDDEYMYLIFKVNGDNYKKRGNGKRIESINEKALGIFGKPFIENGKIRKEHAWRYFEDRSQHAEIQLRIGSEPVRNWFGTIM
ncbi:MAG: hypothetical protein ACI38Y_06350 [Candidatus Methanomethylophilaceae archaeon]